MRSPHHKSEPDPSQHEWAYNHSLVIKWRMTIYPFAISHLPDQCVPIASERGVAKMDTPFHIRYESQSNKQTNKRTRTQPHSWSPHGLTSQVKIASEYLSGRLLCLYRTNIHGNGHIYAQSCVRNPIGIAAPYLIVDDDYVGYVSTYNAYAVYDKHIYFASELRLNDFRNCCAPTASNPQSWVPSVMRRRNDGKLFRIYTTKSFDASKSNSRLAG